MYPLSLSLQTRYISCGHVIPVPTYNMQSIRLARLVQRPISNLINSFGLDFRSPAQYHFHRFPELEGLPFSRLKYYFPTATVIGLINLRTRVCSFNPSSTIVSHLPLLPGSHKSGLLSPKCAACSCRGVGGRAACFT
jgi:hypothetical protein